ALPGSASVSATRPMPRSLVGAQPRRVVSPPRSRRSRRPQKPGARPDLPLDAAEADVAHARIDRLRAASCGAITQAVIVGAQERAALDDPARHAELRLARVVTACLATGTAFARVGIPISGPLPHVARHVDQPIAVGREAADRHGAAVAANGPPTEIPLPV